MIFGSHKDDPSQAVLSSYQLNFERLVCSLMKAFINASTIYRLPL